MGVIETNEFSDLEAVNAEEIKGGPRLVITKADSLTDEEGLPDLEPTGDVIGGVTKAGEGRLEFSGANTYTGTTTVNEGTLALGYQRKSGDISS